VTQITLFIGGTKMEDWRKKLVEIIRAEKTPCSTEATAKTQRSVEIAEREWIGHVRKAFHNLSARLKDVAVVEHNGSEWEQSLCVNVKGCEGDPGVALEYTIKVVSFVAGSGNRQRLFRCADGRSGRCHDAVSIPNTWTVNDIIENMAQCIAGADG
jgi:hypothetical protein